MSAPLVLAFALVLETTAAEKPPRLVSEIDVRGATVYPREELLGLIRLKPGDPLRREPASIAKGLANRYHIAGYPAAHVRADYDEASGRLTLEVDEGHLTEIAVEGLEGSARSRALETLGLRAGQVLKEGDVWAALARIDTASDGAIAPEGDPPFEVEERPEGPRLVFHLRKDAARFTLKPWGPRASGRYSRVDGVSLGLASEVTLTNASSYNHLRLAARAFYGFRSKDVRYALGVERPFGPEQRFVLGYEYHDLTDSDDAFRRYGLEEIPGYSYNSKGTNDFFRRLGHEAYVFARLGPRVQAGVAFRADGYTSLPVVTDSDEPNPPVEEGRMRSFVGTVRFASEGDLYRTRHWERESFHFPSLYTSPGPKPARWRAEATYEVAKPGLGGDFDFGRFIGRLRFHHPVGARFLFDAVAYSGFTTGDPPLPKRFFLGGAGTLRGYEKKQFTGQDMAQATAEWSWLPPSRFVPVVIPFYDGGVLWGGRSAGTGWKSDVGLGLRWPQATSIFARVDAAVPLDLPPGQARKVQWNVRVQFPF
jgi:hypothetical protein